jgi:long-chain fatty acid transport protein
MPKNHNTFRGQADETTSGVKFYPSLTLRGSVKIMGILPIQRVGLRRFSVALQRHVLVAAVAMAAFGTPRSSPGQGVALRAVSPVNESMAGTGTACPIDAAGALHWNPASISGLPSSDMSFGLGLVLPSSTLSSRVERGAFGGGYPPVTLEGSDRSEAGAIPAPSMAFVHKDAESPWTYGLGVFSVGGSAVNYPSSLSNPILMPQTQGGLGRLSANVDVVQMDPTIAYALNENWSVGFAPTLTMAKLYASPLFLGPRDDSNHDGHATYSSGVGTRYTWGGGFQTGLYYTTNAGWHLGASVKSPQWTEPFRYKSEDELGRPRDIRFDLNYPLITSFGVSYSGFENWVIASDIRYFNYSGTLGFGQSGFASDGAIRGLGWNDIMAVTVGVQRQINERFFLRGGYCYNDNPITSDSVQYNAASPLVIQHSVHTGFSYVFDDNWIVAMAYVHCFENSVTGPMHNPATGQAIAGTSITTAASADVLSMGVTKRF